LSGIVSINIVFIFLIKKNICQRSLQINLQKIPSKGNSKKCLKGAHQKYPSNITLLHSSIPRFINQNLYVLAGGATMPPLKKEHPISAVGVRRLRHSLGKAIKTNNTKNPQPADWLLKTLGLARMCISNPI
jgi:hypothetical protein